MPTGRQVAIRRFQMGADPTDCYPSALGSFGISSSVGYKRFAKKVLDVETKIEQLQLQLIEARESVNILRKALEDYIQKMNVD